MAPDWRKVALAAVTAMALGAGLVCGAFAQSAKTPEPEEAQSDEEPAAKGKAAKSTAKKQDPAEARRAVDAASKMLEAGKAEQAAQALTATLTGGNLPPAILAKAFYVRGLAYRQQGKSAQAISDLTSALWLKGGLGGDERADALKQRSAAYRDAGLAESGEAVAGASTAKSKSWWGGETGSTGQSGQAKSGWWNNLFDWPGSSGSANKPPEAKAALAKPDPAPGAKGPKISSGWSSSTEVLAQSDARAGPREAPPPSSKAPPAAPPRADPPPAAAQGRYRVQLAAVRTQAEAQALAAKAKREHASALAAREPEIDQAVLGNMGAFYLVRVGPFATVQETQAVCAKLKGSGFDCMSVTR
jgi:hypothetical protein